MSLVPQRGDIKHAMKAAIRRNGQKPCSVCGKPRYSLSQYCVHHWMRYRNTGHHNGKHYPIRFFESEIKEIRTIIRINRNHKLVLDALATIDTILYTAGVKHLPNIPRRGNRYVAGVYQWVQEGQLTTTDILAVLGGMTLKNFREDGLFKSDKHFEYSIALKFLKSKYGLFNKKFGGRGNRDIASPILRPLGRMLWDKLGYSLVRLYHAANDRAKENQNINKIIPADAPLVTQD